MTPVQMTLSKAREIVGECAFEKTGGCTDIEHAAAHSFIAGYEAAENSEKVTALVEAAHSLLLARDSDSAMEEFGAGNALKKALKPFTTPETGGRL